MKKFLSILVLLIIFLSKANTVNAKTVTFEEVATKYKEKFNYSKIDETIGSFLQEIENNSTVTTTGSSITTTYHGDSGSVTTTFTHQNGIISYQYAGAKEYNENTELITTIDSIAMVKLIYIISELKGYDLSTNNDIFEDENLTLERNGIEVKRFTVSGNTGAGNASITAAETFRIDLNKFSLAENNNNTTITPPTNNTPSTNNTNNNNIDNPKTGYETYIISSILILVTLLILTKIKNSKNLINKI